MAFTFFLFFCSREIQNIEYIASAEMRTKNATDQRYGVRMCAFTIQRNTRP